MRILLVLLVLGASACVGVKPWERELLAQPGMSFEAEAGAESEQHAFESREAAFGGYGASAGGCGCN
jgi:hypothetical protein